MSCSPWLHSAIFLLQLVPYIPCHCLKSWSLLRTFCAKAHSREGSHIERLTLCGEHAGKGVLNHAQSNVASVATVQKGLSLKKHQWTCRKSAKTYQARKTRSSQCLMNVLYVNELCDLTKGQSSEDLPCSSRLQFVPHRKLIRGLTANAAESLLASRHRGDLRRGTPGRKDRELR